jgi:hypothetical protein
MEQLIGRVIGGGGGGAGGLFGEAREALLGGCWGVFMSAGFFFLFFATALAMFFGVSGTTFEINLGAIAFPFVCLLGVSAILSPFVGALFGAQSGIYSVVRHIGCFIIYVILLIGGMIAATLYL